MLKMADQGDRAKDGGSGGIMLKMADRGDYAKDVGSGGLC